MTTRSLDHLLAEIAACTVCAPNLEHGPRPIVQAGKEARIVIIGQAPGRRVHESGVPWDDPSGRTLRRWLNLSNEQFYDPDIVALVPMGFCYPGSGPSGDNPPRPECAPLWHERLLSELPDSRLDIIIGTYAQKRYIADRKKTLTATVANWAAYLPGRVVLPHPSPRNQHWLTKNPWFESETLPAVRQRIAEVLQPPPADT
ncbi:MAG: uracil-DNA glycosylase family protein [Acidimicrobiia bacterium]|nr:uracil-DNA glycosylase family protein [Acidimicrobiia bacterium]